MAKPKKPKSARQAARKAKRRTEPWQWSEQHEATEAFVIKDHGKAKAMSARLKVGIAAINRTLTPSQHEAWEAAESGFLALEAKTGAKTSRGYENVDGGRYSDITPDSLAAERFIRWGQALTRAVPQVDFAAVRNVLFARYDPITNAAYTFAWADAHAGRRKGWAVGQVRRALDMWHDVVAKERHERRKDRSTIGVQLGPTR